MSLWKIIRRVIGPGPIESINDQRVNTPSVRYFRDQLSASQRASTKLAHERAARTIAREQRFNRVEEHLLGLHPELKGDRRAERPDDAR